MLRYWRNFARNGDPNGADLYDADLYDADLPLWEQNDASDTLMTFGERTEMLPEGEHALFELLDRMDGWTAP